MPQETGRLHDGRIANQSNVDTGAFLEARQLGDRIRIDAKKKISGLKRGQAINVKGRKPAGDRKFSRPWMAGKTDP